MKKAVIIAGSGFEDSEFFYPYYRLQEAGLFVDVVTHNNSKIKGKYGIVATPTINQVELKALDYDVLILPGGHEGPDRVRQMPKVLSFTKDMFDSKKVISSICHGPWVLVSAKITSGLKMTCYKGCKDDIINSGAQYLDELVVVDGRVITAQHFKDNHSWMKATLEVLDATQ